MLAEPLGLTVVIPIIDMNGKLYSESNTEKWDQCKGAETLEHETI